MEEEYFTHDSTESKVIKLSLDTDKDKEINEKDIATSDKRYRKAEIKIETIKYEIKSA